MEYLTVEEARTERGLRLVLTCGVPGPWSEAAKALFQLHSVAYKPVQQLAGDQNVDLVGWTQHRNAPIALYENEAPRVRWLEILDLAERLGTGPSLVPGDRLERMFMLGLINEIAGEDGFAWDARLLMFNELAVAQGAEAAKNPMLIDYRYDARASELAIPKIEEFLTYLASHIKAQARRGSHFLVGSQFTAADVYWAYFSNLLEALPPEICPTPDGVLKAWGAVAHSISGYDPALIQQRDRIFSEHLTVPLDF